MLDASTDQTPGEMVHAGKRNHDETTDLLHASVQANIKSDIFTGAFGQQDGLRVRAEQDSQVLKALELLPLAKKLAEKRETAAGGGLTEGSEEGSGGADVSKYDRQKLSRRSNAVNYTLNSARVCRTCSRWARERMPSKWPSVTTGSWLMFSRAIVSRA